ncbi:MAG TPA: hypothetical protein VLA09_11680 [Longimicrobiales bacterium]|nr:hypothetical protein [Longimicrobiales bacterium]
MPVFSRMRDGVLVLTVDGDFTANELHRVGFEALEGEDAPMRLPILLDLSGAAGVSNKPPGELARTGAIFAAHRDRLTGIAVVAAGDVSSLFDGQSDFAHEAGVRVQAFASHDDARSWLLEAS